MLVCALAMVYAAAVESWRLTLFQAARPRAAAAAAPGPPFDRFDQAPPGRVELSILWQAPAYILVGASEVLASVGQLEFFYDQVGWLVGPRGLRGGRRGRPAAG